jgi:beta-lactamase regulating signal transducer with metallopeptidase domain/HEAT repeat protein
MLSNFLSDLGAHPAWSASTVVLLLKATIILVAALGVTLAMQRASAGARHLVWLVALGTLLVVPAVAAWAPLPFEILPPLRTLSDAPPARDVAAELSLGAGNAARPDDDGSTALPAATPPATVGTSVGHSPLTGMTGMGGISIFAAIWAAVVLVIASSLAYSALVVRRMVRQAKPLDSEDWLTPLWEIADRLGLDEAPRVLRSEEAKMPFACGVLNPTIVLPAECDTWSLDRRRAVLLHELAHVRRHDLVGHTLGRLACAVYWFHPLVWTAAKRLRSESERACDDLALACGTRATDYAEHLLEIVTSVRRDATPSVALAMARRKEFEGRMLAILDPELRHSSPSRAQSAVLIASLALISLVVGAASPARRVATAAASQVAERQAVRQDSVTRAADSVTRRRAASAASSQGRQPEYPNDFSGAPRTSFEKRTNVEQHTNTDAQPVQQTRTNVANSQSASISTRVSTSSGGGESDAEAALRQLIADGSTRDGKKLVDDRPALLAKILRTDTSAALRRIAAWGLAEYADVPIATQALIEALKKDSDLGVREMAAWSLADANDGSAGVSEALSTALRDPNVEIRRTAAWALGNSGSRGAIDALVAALADSDPGVRQRALWAIGNVEPKQAPKAVVDLLKDKDAEVRQLAAWSLYQIEDPSTAAALEAALRAESDKDLQLDYIRALAALGEKSVDALRGLLESPDSKVKTMAVRALAGGNAAGPWPWPWPEPRPDP